jgi:hypothetical protein
MQDNTIKLICRIRFYSTSIVLHLILSNWIESHQTRANPIETIYLHFISTVFYYICSFQMGFDPIGLHEYRLTTRGVKEKQIAT